MPGFKLDPQLANDSVFLAKLAICQVRLMKDARWPWLLLVPEVEGAEELHALSTEEQQLVSSDVGQCAEALKKITNCRKINIGALGNIVSQLHIHIIARNENDPNWPGPIWGYEKAVPYEIRKQELLMAQLLSELF